MSQIDRHNNFDLIRLVAAFQVMLWHGAVHLGTFDASYNFLAVIYHIPGVPIFFTISGFLISSSFDRNGFNLKKYFRNRSLRIFPALWVCTIITAGLLAYFGSLTNIKEFFVWLIAQFSFFQFYAPTSLKTWGTGHPNGSLWSIAVELQFYVVLPIIILIASKLKKRTLVNLFLVLLFLLSIGFKYFVESNEYGKSIPILTKLSGNFVLYYLHFFLTGIIMYKNYDVLQKWIKDKVLYWFVGYVIYVLVLKTWLGLYENPYSINIFGIIANTILSFLTLSFAFSYQNLSKKLLNENDISYGIYIYHMPIVNTMLSLGLTGTFGHWFGMMAITILIAILSWKLIEKKALSYK